MGRQITQDTALQPGVVVQEATWDLDIAAVLAERATRLAILRADPEKMAAAHLHYKHHWADFIDDWAWTYDPRRVDGPAWMPMVMWPKQREFIDWLQDHYEQQQDGLVEKNRGAGATWLGGWASIVAFRYIPGIKVGWGSRKEALVDRIGDPDSIFEKMRKGMSRLPQEFLPPGFDSDKNCMHLKITHPDEANGASITGEAGDNIGRGGRNSMYFVDEAAHIERPQLVDASLMENTNCRIDMSTVNGPGNPFYNKRHGGAVDVFIFDWRDDPRKSQAWYEEQKAKLDPMVLAQEVDRDYEGAAEDICIPMRYIRAAQQLDLRGVDFAYMRGGLDVGDGGPDTSALCLANGPAVRHLEEWSLPTTAKTTQRALLRCNQAGIDELRYDNIGVGAGVKGESGENNQGIKCIGINAGAGPLKGWHIMPDKHNPRGKKNEDHFLNFKMQMWWATRERFRKTYEYVEQNIAHPIDELVSLYEILHHEDPAMIRAGHKLSAELGGPKYEPTPSGKIKMESKASMRVRGLKSPNLADAFVLTFAPIQSVRRLTW